MSRLYFNKENKIECPTLVLQNKSNYSYGCIVDYSNFTYKRSFNAANEISFTAYKSDNMSEQQLYIWNNLSDLRVIYIPEYNEKFEIKVEKTIANVKTKSVTGTALAESELSQILLREIEINTEIDIENDLYDAKLRTIFYRDIDDIENEKYQEVWSSNKKYTAYNDDGSINEEETIKLRRKALYNSSLLHRLLDKAVNYSIAHVDESLKNLNLIKSFSISNQTIYDELMGEISEEYGVLFKFDSINRTVSAYDLYNTCYDCGYREDFTNICPKCGSTNIGGQYGEDTSILVSAYNLASQLTKNGDPSSVKTYWKIEGGDDLINACVAAINPTGNAYKIYIPDYMLQEMPQGMQDRFSSYNELKDKYVNDINYCTEEGFSISADNINNYNKIVEYLRDYYTEDTFSLIGEEPENPKTDKNNIPYDYNNLIGYDKLTELYYSLIDIESVIKTSLSPTIESDNPTIEDTMAILDELNDMTIAVSNAVSPLDSYVDNAVVNMAEAMINTALFDIDVKETSYSADKDTRTGIWTGTIVLTNKETKEDETPETLEKVFTLTITEDIITYTQQKIQKNMARVDVTEILNLTSLEEETWNGTIIEEKGKTWIEWFTEELNYYSVDNLTRLQTEFLACQSVILQLQDDLNEKGNLEGVFKLPSEHFYDIYTERLELINAELDKKTELLNQLYKLYQYDSKTNLSTGEVANIRKKVNNLLDFQKYMEGEENEENYWGILCSYLREDTYSNSNYISTKLNNKLLIERTKELIEVANREIQKSAFNQYTISSTMNNLFQLKEFAPIKDYFDVGNWIRVDVDDEIHRLRLLNYQINYDSMQDIDVEFSNVVYSPTSYSDKQSIFNSVASMSSSYDALTRQVNTTNETLDEIAGKVGNGIDSTYIKIVNDGTIEDIVIDKNGILGRAYDDITGEYDDCQYKFIRNGLYMTNDNWKSVYNTIGKFKYDTGEVEIDDDGVAKPIYAIAYGVKADTIVGNLIFGKELKIRNENNTLSFDVDGLLVDNGVSTIQINPNDLDGILFRISKYDDKKDEYRDIMFVDNQGDGHFAGTINAENGNIGGWEIDQHSIFTKVSFIENKYKVSFQAPYVETVIDDNITMYPHKTILSVEETAKGYTPIEITTEKIETYDGDVCNSTMSAGKIKFNSGSEAHCEISGEGLKLKSSELSDYASVNISEASIEIEGNQVIHDGRVKESTINVSTSQYGEASFDTTGMKIILSVRSGDYKYGVFWYGTNGVRVFDVENTSSGFNVVRNTNVPIIVTYVRS